MMVTFVPRALQELIPMQISEQSSRNWRQ